MKPIDDATPPQTAAAAGAPGHTPGPWSDDLDLDGTLRADDGTPICQIADHNQTEANARLIAAAPEAHEANKASLLVLCSVLALPNLHKNFIKDIEFAIAANRAALSKATGAPQAASETSVTPTPTGEA